MSRVTRAAMGFFVYSLTITVVLIAAGFWSASHEFTKTGPLQETMLIDIERGSSLNAISQTLEEKKAIHYAPVFVFGARVLGVQSQLKAGEYELEAGISAQNILRKMRDGKTFRRSFTIPEGLTSYEVMNILNNVPDLEGEITEAPDEGTLLPETYDYRRGENRERLIGRMQQAMTGLLDSAWEKRAGDLPFATKAEALTLASIIEKETALPEERRRIAGVLVNRLRKGIPLQVDPTVIYAITEGQPKNEGMGPLGRRLLKKDLEFDSPYNTYLHASLPPGPIGNPGRASVEAALNPEPHEYFYFVADGKGGHVFSKTLEEHNANVEKWRKIRAQE